MITTTVMRRVLARLESEAHTVAARANANSEDYFAARNRRDTFRRMQGDDSLIADLAAALNFETRGAGV